MKILMSLALFVTTSVFAAEIKVFDEYKSYFYPHIDTSWTVNKKNGTAAVNVRVYNNEGPQQGNQQSKTFTKTVEGLYFDKDTSKIMLTHEGQLFECATVVKKWYGNRFYEKDCELDARVVKVGRHAYHQVFITTK